MGEHQSCDEGILQCLKSKTTIIIKIPQSSLLGEGVETTLVTIYKETMFLETLEYLFNMLLIVSHVVGKDEDVVQIDQDVDV